MVSSFIHCHYSWTFYFIALIYSLVSNIQCVLYYRYCSRLNDTKQYRQKLLISWSFYSGGNTDTKQISVFDGDKYSREK